MATTTGKSLSQLQAEKEELISQGKTLSTSKELGKIEDAIKVLNPSKYGAETVASAQKKLANSTQSAGVPGLYGPGGSGSGSLDLDSLYEQYFESDDVKSKKEELSTIEAARDEAIGNIQNNPWFSQATRGGKIAAIKSDAERNLQRINDELMRMQTDAQIKYNIQLQQYNINRQEYQDALNLFGTLVNSGALTSASGSDIAKLSVQTGIPTSMINSIVQTAKTKNLDLQGYDDGINQYVIALDPEGNIVNKTTLGPSKPTGSGTSTTAALGYIPTSQQSAKEVLKLNISPPPMSAVPGTQMEWGGVTWVMTQNGWS